MNSKLTLSIEQSLIERGKVYAKEKGRSLSDIIENYLKMITTEEEIKQQTTPIVNSLRGAFKEPTNFDYKKDLTDALTKKYLDSDV